MVCVCVCATARDLLKLKPPHNEQVGGSLQHPRTGLLTSCCRLAVIITAVSSSGLMTITSRGSDCDVLQARAGALATVRGIVQHLMDGWVLVAFFENNVEKRGQVDRTHPGIDETAIRGAWYGPAVIDCLPVMDSAAGRRVSLPHTRSSRNVWTDGHGQRCACPGHVSPGKTMLCL
jgi:hypothetical protein